MALKLAELFVEITAKGFTDLLGQFGAVGSAVSALSGGIGMVGGEISGFLTDTIGEAMGAEEAFTRLSAQLDATGGAAGFTAEELEGVAGEIQKVTTFSDEAVMGAQAALAAFSNIRGDTFDRTTRAAADMASALEMDVGGAAKQLGKALNNPEKGLTLLARAGIFFSDSEKKMVKEMLAANDVLGAQKVILDKVEGRYGGMAEKMGNTTSGKITRMTNAWSDFMELIGGALTPALGTLAERGQESIQWLSDSIGSLDEWGFAIEEAAAAMYDFGADTLAETFGAIEDFIWGNMDTWVEWGSLLADIGVSVYQGFVQVFTSIGSFISGLFPTDGGSIKDWITGSLELIALFARNFSDFMVIAALGAAEAFSGWYDSLGDSLTKARVLFVALWEGVKAGAMSLIDQILAAFNNFFIELVAQAEAWKAYATAYATGGDADAAYQEAYDARVKTEGGFSRTSSLSIGDEIAGAFAASFREQTNGLKLGEESDTTAAIRKERESREKDIELKEAERAAKIKAQMEKDELAAALDEMFGHLDEEAAPFKTPGKKDRPEMDDFSKAEKEKKGKKDKGGDTGFVGIQDFAKKIQESILKNDSQKKIEDNTSRTAKAVETIAEKMPLNGTVTPAWGADV